MVRLCPLFKFKESGNIKITSDVPSSGNGEVNNTVGHKRGTFRILHDESTQEQVIPPQPIKEEETKNPAENQDLDELIESKPIKEEHRGRKSGVVVSAIDSTKTSKDINYEKFEKDDKSTKLIRNALASNEFLRNLLDDDRLEAVVEAMHSEEYEAGDYIIREGETGSHLYVSDSGTLDVIKSNKIVKKISTGEVFGELAILYKAKRFASIKASNGAKVWVLERRVFQKIMVKSGKQELEDNVRFLSSVPIFDGIHEKDIIKMSDFLRREFFIAGTMIVRQGERGDKFYIIRGGTVVITQRPTNGGSDRFIMEVSRGGYFGEQALLHEDRRLATVTAKAPGVECLTIERGPFIEFLGSIAELRSKSYETTVNTMEIQRKKKVEEPTEYRHILLQDLEIVGTLGVGAFGRVELVQYKKDKNITFALKCLKKVDVVLQQQQEHAFSEKNIMYRCNSPFICKLYRTYKDSKYLYFLMEPILGGDVWTVLQRKRYFDEKTAKFMSACVVEALEHLHNLNIVYRDLKPENLMLDSKGYVKVVDFGYAKFLSTEVKTYTFAGTPEYVAPEIILGNGHDRAVDYWALGIFIHELLVGKPPFRGTNHVKTYNLIIRGIDAIDFNPKISKIAQELIKKLCKSLPTERLGYLKNKVKDIKNHKWFLGFDWDKLRERKMQAPLVRTIASNKDLSNFEKYEKEKLPPDETSGWDLDF